MAPLSPRFSIVIPCYNEEVHLPSTLESLLGQDYDGAYEVIVVDNNSTDASAHIAQAFGVRVVTETRPGVCFARQAGFEAAQGEVVVSADADSVADPDWLTHIDRRFRSRPDTVAVCGHCDFVAAPWWGRAYSRLLWGTVRLWYRLTGRPFYITATNTAFLRNAFSGYDTTMTQGGDELAVLHQLRRRGHVHFSLKHPVHTSSRRLEHGLWYNLVITFFYYYLLAYHVNRLAGRTVIGMAPAYREKRLSESVRQQLLQVGQRSWSSVPSIRVHEASRPSVGAAPRMPAR